MRISDWSSDVCSSDLTALKIDQEITANAEEDAMLTILNGGDRAARRNQQGQADRIAGSNAAKAGRLNQASTLLEGAALTARRWKRDQGGGEGGVRADTGVQKNGATAEERGRGK